jgi:hypothetical protein
LSKNGEEGCELLDQYRHMLLMGWHVRLKCVDFSFWYVNIHPLHRMDKSRKEFLLILTYLYIRYGK